MLESDKLLIVIVAIFTMMCLTAIIGTVYARNITTFIHFNEEAIKEDTYLGDIWFTVDGKNYSSSYTDADDLVYGSDPEIEEDLFTDEHSQELMVADNATKICLEEISSSYRSCSQISILGVDGVVPNNATEVHFTYPASWQS